jgi:hypothetical protein
MIVQRRVTRALGDEHLRSAHPRQWERDQKKRARRRAKVNEGRRSGYQVSTFVQSPEPPGDFEIPKEGTQGWRWRKGGIMEFVMFEDVDGLEVFVNPERVIWVREQHNQTTIISCGHEDKFAVRLAPAHAVAALGKTAR